MQELQKYQLTDAMIAEAKDQFLKLTIAGIDDTAGLKAVHSARMTVKNWRIDVEKARKAEKSRILEYGKALDAEARRLTDLLTPIEDHLEAEERRITEEKARLKAEREAAEAEAERKRQERIYMRIGLLAEYGDQIGLTEAETLTDDEYNARLSQAMEDHTTRMRAEQEALEAEQARLEQIRLEQVAERERIAEERRVIEEEKRAMAAEKAARDAESDQVARKEKALEYLIAEGEKVVQVCEETKERIEEVREIVAIEIAAAEGPVWPTPEAPAFPRDHFTQEIIGEIVDIKDGEIHYAKARFYIHPSSSSVRLVAGIDELHSAIDQWIDETAELGTELRIKIVKMLDSEYEDIMSAGGL